ncbi:hypothetical protein AB6A40_002641 [Gnathostoma spinigerum]|uniref:TGF-beta family profile domain-containing protein n=1 Tax=Gnathostoma spinigerum TaxID=75299 RepID=A0ABD6EGX6_9BILA
MTVVVAAQRSLRQKREENGGCTESGCCMKSFYLNFTDISWNKWIVHPPGSTNFNYFFNYCTGTCLPGFSYQNHHEVMSAVVHYAAPHSFPLACCTPTGYRSLKITYTTGFGIFRERLLNDLIVKGCGCG